MCKEAPSILRCGRELMNTRLIIKGTGFESLFITLRMDVPVATDDVKARFVAYYVAAVSAFHGRHFADYVTIIVSAVSVDTWASNCADGLQSGCWHVCPPFLCPNEIK